jgi:hypothetical protein
MPLADVDYEGKELTSFAAAVAYSETTGRDVHDVRGWNGKSQTKGGKVWWNKIFVSVCTSVPSTIAIIITTIATSVTAA